MTKELTAATFDYGALDKDVKGKLLSILRDINREKAKHQESGMEIGKSVAAAHALLATEGRDGKFSEWVEGECGFSRTTAYNYMWTWQKFGNCSTVEQFDDGALYALASPKAPEKAVSEAVKLADKGQKITLDKAKELLERFREVEKRKPAPTTAGENGKQRQNSPATSSGSRISGGTTFDTAEMQSESKDAFGKEAPDELAKVFELCEGFEAQLAKLTSIQTWITQNENHPGAVVLASSASRIRADIRQASSEIKYAKPYCACVYCKNKSPKVANCTACKGLGWITEPVFNQAPEALKRESKRSA